MNKHFEDFVQRFESRTGLRLIEDVQRPNYREYLATSNGFDLFKVGASYCEEEGFVRIGMVSQPDMFELDPQSSASYKPGRLG